MSERVVLQPTLASLRKTAINPVYVVLMRTGHAKLWIKNNDTYNSGEPGIGLGAAKWLIEQDIAMVGADNWGLEVLPGESAERIFPVHQTLLSKRGVYILENVRTDELVADRAWEFMFVLGAPRFVGAVQMVVNPVAIR